MIQPSVTIHTTPAGHVVELAGDLDYLSAQEAREAIQGLSLTYGEQLLIDLSGLTFCDSSGIGVLFFARNHALSTGSEVALAAVSSVVRRTLQVAGVYHLFPVYSTEQEATKAWMASNE